LRSAIKRKHSKGKSRKQIFGLYEDLMNVPNGYADNRHNAVPIQQLSFNGEAQEEGQCTYKAIYRRLRVTTAAMEKHKHYIF
jgi:hypothetical protein